VAGGDFLTAEVLCIWSNFCSLQDGYHYREHTWLVVQVIWYMWMLSEALRILHNVAYRSSSPWYDHMSGSFGTEELYGACEVLLFLLLY